MSPIHTAPDGAASPLGDSPFVFVVGCPRSGTTLLQRMLDHHSLLAVANDTHFIPRCLEQHAPHLLADAASGRTVPLTPQLAGGVSEYHRFHRLGLDPAAAQAAARGAETYADYVRALYRRFAQAKGKPLGGEKTPDYVRRIPLLHGLFPDARFVHIIRDGRDTALSILDWAGEDKGPAKLPQWRIQPMATCALWWRWLVGQGRDDGAGLGGGLYLEVRYEELVARPAEELSRVCRFLGLDWEPGVLAYNAGRATLVGSGSAKSRWLPPTPGLRDWRTQMTDADTALFEALAGDLLDDLGLPRALREIPAATAEIARDATLRWDEHLTRRARRADGRAGAG